MEMKKIICAIIVLQLSLVLIGCGRNYKRWWNYGTNWQTIDGKVHLYYSVDEDWSISFSDSNATVSYEISRANNGSRINIYEKDKVSLDNVVMVADTKIVNGKLELTFTKDTVYDLTGTTIVLELIDTGETSENQ